MSEGGAVECRGGEPRGSRGLNEVEAGKGAIIEKKTAGGEEMGEVAFYYLSRIESFGKRNDGGRCINPLLACGFNRSLY